MNIGTHVASRFTSTGGKRPRRAAAKAAPRFRRPIWHVEQLEDRSLLAAAGDIDWVRQFGSLFPANTQGRAVDADGNVYIAGHTFGALPGQVGNGSEDMFVSKYDAAGNEIWTREFGDGGSGLIFPVEFADAIAVYGSSVYVAGSLLGVLPGQASAGIFDAYVRNYDSDGNEIWTRQFGTTASEHAQCLAADATGVYVGGSTLGVFPGQTSSGFSDAFVRKYDPDGTELWTRQFGNNNSSAETATGIAVDSSGVYVSATVGIFNQSGELSEAFLRKYTADGTELWTRVFGTVVGDKANTVAVDATGVYVGGSTFGALPGQTRVGGDDAFVRKFDATGAELWTRQFGTTGDDAVFGLSADGSNVYVGGQVGLNGALPGQTTSGNKDAFLRKYDAGGTELWTRQFGTTDADDIAGVTVDATDIYVIGTAGRLPGQGGPGAFLRKYDPSGGATWTRQLGRTSTFEDLARAVDADGNVYVAGEVNGLLPGSPFGIGFDADAFVRKYDAAGNQLWTRQFGTLLRDAVTGIAVDASGIYLVGVTLGTLPGQTSAGNADAFVRKYDAAGNELWTRQFGSATNAADTANAVAVNASGVYVAGVVGGTLSGQTNNGDQDAFVRKYDLDGNELWTRQFGGNRVTGPISFPPNDSAAGVAVDTSGVYLSGSTFGVFAGQTTAGSQDAFVCKYDANGAEVWIRQFGTSSADGATGIAADITGIYLTGSTGGTLPGETRVGGQDAFVRKYDANGAAIWTRQFGTTGSDQANGVALGATGVYIAGFVGGALPGKTVVGGQDAFVRKYDTDGVAIWTGQFGTTATDSAAGVSIGPSGLFVAGSTTGGFPGQTFGTFDAFVAKIVDDVSNTAPSNVSLNLSASIDENGTATLSGSFIDPDAADTHTVVINWGTGEGTTTLNLAAGVTTFSASHIYLDDGPPGTASDIYTVSATVTEPAGGSANGSANITVNNVAPTAVNESAVTNEDLAVAIAVLANDSDVAGALDLLQITSITSGAKGTTTINTKGTADTTDDEFIYTPNPGASGSDSFTYTISDGDSGVATATVNVQIQNLVDLSGRVFDDKDNDGSYEPEGGDIGIGGVSVQLFDQSSDALLATQTTAADGTYLFDVNQGAGTYKIVAAQSVGFLDGRETAGNLGGTVDNTQDNSQIANISVGAPGTTVDAIDYLFARILPSQSLGMVWVDVDNDGEIDFGESAIAGVAIELMGLDDRGQAVSRNATTDASGAYAFLDLRPSGAGGYTIRELQPAGYSDGRDTLGTVNGVAFGNNSVNDTFSGVELPRPNSLAEDYNFGERSPTDGGVQAGQTATIGFWQNKNGQTLIKSVSGGPTATQLGNWLAATFPNMYGNLAGQTNAQVAAFYKTLFARTSFNAAGGGPPRMDAQVMATALAVYVTNQSLAGTTAAAFGFVVTASGVGTRTFNVGSSGAAFGFANNTGVSVLELLLAVNGRSHSGLLFDLDGDGNATDSLETSYRTMANDVFSAINESGDI